MLPTEVQVFRKFINKEKISLKLYFLILANIPVDLIELILRYIPGSVGFFLRRTYYKLRFYKIGKNIFIDTGVHFLGHKNIEILDYSYIDKNCIIVALDKLKIGKRVHLGAFSIVHAGVNGPIIVGDYVGISANTKIYSSVDKNLPNKRMSGPMITNFEKVSRSRPINIEKDSFLGANCLILPGANIGYGAIVSPNAVIQKKIDDLTVVDSNGKKLKDRIFNL